MPEEQQDFLGLRGRRFLVTGSTGTIGKSVVSSLAKEGAVCVVHGRSSKAVKKVLDGMHGEGHDGISADLTSQEAVDEVVDFSANRLGGIDGVVHCAGKHLLSSVKTVELDELSNLFEINISSGIMIARSFRRRGISMHGGSLVFLGSVTGLVGDVGNSAYAASKGAVISMTRSLALELARDGIRVNSISAGALKSGMLIRSRDKNSGPSRLLEETDYPLGLGNGQDVANCALFLLSERSSWITGANIAVDGGFTAR